MKSSARDNMYRELLMRARLISKDIKQIDLDINRTYRDHLAFRKRYDVKYACSNLPCNSSSDLDNNLCSTFSRRMRCSTQKSAIVKVYCQRQTSEYTGVV